MAKPTELNVGQKAMFFRRIQVILIGVMAVSALEHSSKRTDQLQADVLRSVKADRANQRADQRIPAQPAIKTLVPRKASAQSVATEQAIPHTKSSIALKSTKALVKPVQ
jgi:hypothetical protein